MSAPQSIPGLPGPASAAGGENAVLRSIGRCFGLTIISGGLWAFAWIYHQAKEVSPRIGEPASAGGRTFGYLIPIANWVVTGLTWRDIDNYAKRSGTEGFPVVLYLILSIFISPLILIFYPLTQSRLNAAHIAATGGAATNAPMYKADWIAVIVGIVGWILAILLILIVVLATGTSESTVVTGVG